MDEIAIRARITAIDKTLAELKGELDGGYVDIGRYTRLKTEWEQKKAELEAQLPTVSTPTKIIAQGFEAEAFTLGHLSQLLQILDSRFSDGELRTLCFHMSIDYDDLPGEGQADKVRELLRYLERRENILELVKIGRQLRPDIRWNDIVTE